MKKIPALLISDWIGLGLGTLCGLIQCILFFHSELSHSAAMQSPWPGVAFGLIAPAMLALLSRGVTMPMQSIHLALGKYVNTLFFAIAALISAGISALAYYFIVGVTHGGLDAPAFFIAAGIGFIFAYLINPALAFRPTGEPS